MMANSKNAELFKRFIVSPLTHWPTFLIITYIFAAFSWSMPADKFPRKDSIVKYTEKPLFFFGLWQDWNMFAPNPRNEDIWMDLHFLNRDGTLHTWALTDMVKMPFIERWRQERWRKYFNDHLRLDDEKRLWQPFADYSLTVLRQRGYDPVTIDFVRHWRPTQIPVRPDLRADVRKDPWKQHLFFHWQIPETPRSVTNGGPVQ
jgi:hypothetical protein